MQTFFRGSQKHEWVKFYAGLDWTQSWMKTYYYRIGNLFRIYNYITYYDMVIWFYGTSHLVAMISKSIVQRWKYRKYIKRNKHFTILSKKVFLCRITIYHSFFPASAISETSSDAVVPAKGKKDKQPTPPKAMFKMPVSDTEWWKIACFHCKQPLHRCRLGKDFDVRFSWKCQVA